MLETTSASVARVFARGCGGTSPNRVASGFLWRDRSTVVTARHVVAGCSNISVRIGDAEPLIPARAERQLKAQDLVALRLSNDAPAPPLAAVSAPLPPVNSRVAVLGYALGAPTLDSKILDVTFANAPPGSRLRDMLSNHYLNLIQSSGELSVDAEILRLDGNLQPGHSGAPIIDSAGRVVAIGAGGLQQGAGGLVWGVRASYLSQLASAPVLTAPLAPLPASTLAFAYQPEQSDVTTFECGPATLVKRASARLSDLTATTDDPLGLQQLMGTFGISPAGAFGTYFDIWVDADTGATFALPQNADVDSVPGGCAAHIDDNVTIHIRPVVLSAATTDARRLEVQAASQLFETSIVSRFPAPPAVDPSSTYRAPQQRQDTFVVMRTGYTRPRLSDEPGQVIFDYAFFTHMTRGERYYGVAATRQNLASDASLVLTCPFAPSSTVCAEQAQRFDPWGKAALAVHLATIPPI